MLLIWAGSFFFFSCILYLFDDSYITFPATLFHANLYNPFYLVKIWYRIGIRWCQTVCLCIIRSCTIIISPTHFLILLYFCKFPDSPVRRITFHTVCFPNTFIYLSACSNVICSFLCSLARISCSDKPKSYPLSIIPSALPSSRHSSRMLIPSPLI